MTLKFRDVVIFSGHRFRVPEHVQRLDTHNTHAWQLRYGKWKTYSDHTPDGSGARAALKLAVAELRERIDRLPAPTGLRRVPLATKSSGLPVGISGPVARTRSSRQTAEYNFAVTIPRFGRKPGNASVYIGTANTASGERYQAALAKAIEIRLRAERAYQMAATKAKRAGNRTAAKRQA